MNITFTESPIYVVDMDNNPLMPTFHKGKVRRLLKDKKAKIYKREPFTIKLLYPSSNYKQECILGSDPGKTNGISVISNNKELFSAKLETRSHNIKELLEDKLMYRRQRRNSLRYRKPRFNNRKSSKSYCKVCGENTKTGQEICSSCLKKSKNNHFEYSNIQKKKLRFNPTSNHKMQTHLNFIDKISQILPINKNILETAKFDIQKINNPDIISTEYQNGPETEFYNTREYVLFRDNYKCQNLNCKEKNDILNVHHIIFKNKFGGTDKQENLITLCLDCHTPKNHQKGNILYNWCIEKQTANSIKNKNKDKQKSHRDATQTSVLSSNLKRTGIFIETFGYKTKSLRINLGLEKDHHNDAFCIANSNNNLQKYQEIFKIKTPFIFIQKRRHNRSMSTFHDAKYIDKRDNSIKTGKELSKDLRVFRKCKLYSIKNNKIKFSHGYFSKQTKLNRIKKHDIVKFENKYFESGGMTNNNVIFLNSPDMKFKTINKVNLICNRNGIIFKK